MNLNGNNSLNNRYIYLLLVPKWTDQLFVPPKVHGGTYSEEHGMIVIFDLYIKDALSMDVLAFVGLCIWFVSPPLNKEIYGLGLAFIITIYITERKKLPK